MCLAAFLPTASGLSSAYRWVQAFLCTHSGNSDDESKTVPYLLCIGFCPMLMMHLRDLENSILVYHFTFSPIPTPPAYAIPTPAP